MIQDDSGEPQTLVAYFSSHPDPDGVEVHDSFKVGLSVLRLHLLTRFRILTCACWHHPANYQRAVYQVTSGGWGQMTFVHCHVSIHGL